MGNYTPEYGTDDLSEITVDAVGTTFNAGVDYVDLWVILAIVGVIVGSIAVLVAKMKGRRR